MLQPLVRERKTESSWQELIRQDNYALRSSAMMATKTSAAERMSAMEASVKPAVPAESEPECDRRAVPTAVIVRIVIRGVVRRSVRNDVNAAGWRRQRGLGISGGLIAGIGNCPSCIRRPLRG